MSRLYLVMMILAAGAVAYAGHLDNIELLEGCGSCHVGHGLENEPMLDHSEEKLCYQCHGNETEKARMISEGKLANWSKPGNVRSEFDKQYRHPVEDGSRHSPIEQIPSTDGRPADHAECADCHNVHRKSIQSGQVERVSGFSLTERYLKEATEEYEICLKCHADNEALRGDDDTNIRRQFDLSARSLHPVTRPAQGKHRTSLTAAATGMQSMKCSDCHTSDDPNAPQGPHGSRYRFLLSGNYDIDVYADETPWSYQFCYKCHDRNSLLADQSFKYHSMHIEGDPVAGRQGTSCYSCHASHGSTNDKLISFNREAVSPGGSFNRIEYISRGPKAGSCTLTCHGHQHDQVDY